MVVPGNNGAGGSSLVEKIQNNQKVMQLFSPQNASGGQQLSGVGRPANTKQSQRRAPQQQPNSIHQRGRSSGVMMISPD